MSSQATGATMSSESSRSSTPPWPGRIDDMSFVSRSRFIIDSIRSPSVAAITAPAPSTRPTQAWPFSSKIIPSAPPATHRITDPASPSQVFFGLIAGTIRCLPNRMPAK